MKRLPYFSLGCMLIIIFLILPLGCKKNNPTPTPQIPITTDSVGMQINKFIWFGLNYRYYWVDSVAKLAPVYFHNNLDSLSAFLSEYTDHEKLFDTLLYQRGKVDKWSWIVDDYVTLQNYFQGITKSLGYNYGLARINNSNDIFGFVEYVIKGSPADNAGIKRGDVFIKVNGTQLTVSNYQNLLVDSLGYTLSFANNNTITPNGKNLTLAATVVYENPVFYDTIFNINGYKVGYLLYNGFTSDYDIQLNQVFSTFKGAGVNKLILDLRYNGGGSIQSANYLASMIYSTALSKSFINYQFNKYYGTDLLNYYGANYFTWYFTDIIAQSGSNPQTPISNLGLTDLYVITTNNTASASELIINGLKPYMTVVTIGETTVGKNVASVTIQDKDSYGNVNPNHKWAMQAIVGKIFNSSNQSNYGGVGFIPTVPAQEDIANLLPFGNPNEPLLSAALNYIGGLKSAPIQSKSSAYRKIANSKDFIPHSKEMYFNNNSLKNLPNKKSFGKSIF